MTTIIDFSGYYYKNDFIIKEYCESSIQENSKKVGFVIVTATPIEHLKDINFIDDIYSIYLMKYGIPLECCTHRIEELKDRILKVLSKSEVVFVRNKQQRRDLFNFIKTEPDHVKLLEKFNFNVSLEIMDPCCSYHIKKQGFYCARVNVKYMSKLLLKKFHTGSQPSSIISYPKPSTSKESKSEKTKPVTKTVHKNRNYAVVNFSGYFNLRRTNLIIKELSVYVFNDQEVKIHHNLLIVNPPFHRIKLNEMKNHYNYSFYNTYGIEWEAGNCTSNDVQIELTSLGKKYNVKYIFVSGVDKKLQLLDKFVFNHENIICLSEYGYNPTQEISTSPESKCGNHSHPLPNKNVCADYCNKIMLQWILATELYKDEVLESVRNFKNLLHNQLGYKIVNEPPAKKFRSDQLKIARTKEISIAPKTESKNVTSTLASSSRVTWASDQPSTSRGFQSEQVSAQRSRNSEKLGNINFEILLNPTVNDNNNVTIDFDNFDSNHNLVNTIFVSINPPVNSSVNNQEIHESDLEIGDEVLDTLAIPNFVSSWRENESEPINLDDIFTDDQSSSEQTSKSEAKLKSNDSDSDLFEKLLQSDVNEQLENTILDSHYQELDEFLL